MESLFFFPHFLEAAPLKGDSREQQCDVWCLNGRFKRV